MNRKTLKLLGAGACAMVALSLLVSVAAAQPSDLAVARAQSARFNSIGQAEGAGYGLLPEGAPLHECIASFDGSGAMGLHYINGGLLDGTLDPANPEALVYAPDGHGNLRLAALEYVVFEGAWSGSEPPTLFGEELMFTPAPNRYDIPAFYALHVWLWDDNPSGLFQPFNPDVACP
jgi:hypothetical protein